MQPESRLQSPGLRVEPARRAPVWKGPRGRGRLHRGLGSTGEGLPQVRAQAGQRAWAPRPPGFSVGLRGLHAGPWAGRDVACVTPPLSSPCGLPAFQDGWNAIQGGRGQAEILLVGVCPEEEAGGGAGRPQSPARGHTRSRGYF